MKKPFHHNVLEILEKEYSLSYHNTPPTEETIPSFVQRTGNRKPYDVGSILLLTTSTIFFFMFFQVDSTVIYG